MTVPCIHGFRTEECTACRSCPHGLVTSRCSRCIKASSTPAGRKALLVAHGDHPSEERAGFEIFYVPELNGWQVRSNDEAASAESYRSVFLARKAVDDLAAAGAAREAKRNSQA
jgi:hypothetical protein